MGRDAAAVPAWLAAVETTETLASHLLMNCLGVCAAGAAGAHADSAGGFEGEWDVLPLRCVHRRRTTGFEDSKEMPLQPDDVIAGRYQA